MYVCGYAPRSKLEKLSHATECGKEIDMWRAITICLGLVALMGNTPASAKGGCKGECLVYRAAIEAAYQELRPGLGQGEELRRGFEVLWGISSLIAVRVKATGREGAERWISQHPGATAERFNVVSGKYHFEIWKVTETPLAPEWEQARLVGALALVLFPALTLIILALLILFARRIREEVLNRLHLAGMVGLGISLGELLIIIPLVQLLG